MKKICSLFIALMAVFSLSAQNFENGFYLAGSMNGWQADAAYHFVGNPSNPAEFMLETTLTAGDEFKVANYLDGTFTAWYPNGDNYVVDAAHAGNVTIYFQPDYKADWAEFGGYFYIAVPEAPAMNLIYEWPALTEETVGITFFGPDGVESSTVKIHTNTDDVNCIKFSSSYNYADGKYIAIKPNEGGFKAGDVLSVAAVFNNSNDTKYAQVDLRAADGATRIWLSDSASTINGRTQAGDPIVQTYTLESDQDSLLLGRYGNTAMCVTLIKVERAAQGGGETPGVLEAPDAAPAAPTYPAEQVKAVYSATYSADCNFGEWGSATAYAQEEFGKKYVTGGLGYFGLEFGGMNCSEMETLHLDVWAAEDLSFRVVPIHGGTEVGVMVQVQGQQWNAIDIPMSEFAGVNDWSNVYQIKIDNAANMTFWLNNVYFYTTVAPTVDLEDGFYIIGLHGWTIYDLAAADKFVPNGEEGEYMLSTTLEQGKEFKVVAVANNELGAWYPGEAGNYAVDRAHAGEKIVYFRPDYQGGEGWHAGCIYVPATEDLSPITSEFFTYGWASDTESSAVWDAENQKITVNIVLGKDAQWQSQVKYYGPVAEEGKCYHVALKMVANKVVNSVVAKYQDVGEMMFVNTNLAADVEFVIDTVVAGLPGNGVLIMDFGFAEAGTVVEVTNIVIEEVACPEVEHTYTVAGSSEVAFGTTWDPTNAANDMTLVEGIYTWEKTGLELAAGELKFKVCQDHAWTVNYPAQDYVVNIAESGIYTLTITYNPEGNVVAADAVKTGDAVVIPTVAMHGNFTGTWVDTENFTIAEDKATASLKLNLAAGNYEFGMRIGGTGNWTANGVAFNRENNAAEVVAGQGNLTLAADVEGEYTFTWTYETNMLSIAFPMGDGVENTAADAKVVKMIENGQLIILKNGVRYNAQGAIVR